MSIVTAEAAASGGAPTPTDAGYIPRLDTFRAIAALSIVHLHYFTSLLPPQLQFRTGFGVPFFFVLSGFLITGILLDARAEPASGALAEFYIRRTFRIFPLYYAVLAFALAVGIPGAWASLPWSPLYLVDVGLMRGHDFVWLNHFWSLAIEEQFYLLWPLAVLLTRRACLIAIALVVAGSLYRLAMAGADGRLLDAVNLVSHSDLLAIGALGAFACRRFGATRVEAVLRPLLLVGVPAVVLLAIKWVYPVLPVPLMSGPATTVCGLAYLWLVVRAVRDGPGASSWGGRLLPAIGRISYGIYIWHYVLLAMASPLERSGWSPFGARMLCLAATFAAAALSYRLLEQPLRSLGREIARRAASATNTEGLVPGVARQPSEAVSGR
jgi:peptidoglycan/LPS O-acetylase OafA/YrhL